MKTFAIAALAGIAAASVPTMASAADFSFTGSFLTDDGKAAFTFNLAAASTVTIQSFGYLGGVNAAGQAIAAGGFDDVLSLYDSTSQNVINSDDAFTIALAAGSYKLFLTQYDNFGPANLALPFNFDGQPNFRGGFVDFDGSKRTGNWALDITGVTTASAVPEASTWALMLVGFGMAGSALRARRRVSVSFS
jgi:PEP-CTERM motif